MSRIIAGELGGRRLAVPGGRTTRPTSDRTREALFSSLSATHDLHAGTFLDLYAGSGAVGLEAVSRGAPDAVLVEASRDAARVIQRNIQQLGVSDRVRLVTARVAAAIEQLGGLGATTVFLDPPYDDDAEQLAETVRRLVADGVAAADALIVVERDRRSAWRWPDGTEALRDRRYGETVLWYGRPL